MQDDMGSILEERPLRVDSASRRQHEAQSGREQQKYVWGRLPVENCDWGPVSGTQLEKNNFLNTHYENNSYFMNILKSTYSFFFKEIIIFYRGI